MKPTHLLRILLAGLALALVGCGPKTKSVAPAAPTEATTPGDAVAGNRVYDRVCIVCHQANGAGVPGAVPPLAGTG